MTQLICEIDQCYYNKDKRCLNDQRMFYCPKGRDEVKVVYDDDINVTHSSTTIAVSHISITFKGRYGAMLADLKGKDRMYHEILDAVLKAGIDKLWFEKNAREKEI